MLHLFSITEKLYVAWVIWTVLSLDFLVVGFYIALIVAVYYLAAGVSVLSVGPTWIDFLGNAPFYLCRLVWAVHFPFRLSTFLCLSSRLCLSLFSQAVEDGGFSLPFFLLFCFRSCDFIMIFQLIRVVSFWWMCFPQFSGGCGFMFSPNFSSFSP